MRDNSPVYLDLGDLRDKRTRIRRLMTRMTRTIGSAEKLIAPSRSFAPMAPLTWGVRAKLRFLQTHLGDSSYSLYKLNGNMTYALAGLRATAPRSPSPRWVYNSFKRS